MATTMMTKVISWIAPISLIWQISKSTLKTIQWLLVIITQTTKVIHQQIQAKYFNRTHIKTIVTWSTIIILSTTTIICISSTAIIAIKAIWITIWMSTTITFQSNKTISIILWIGQTAQIYSIILSVLVVCWIQPSIISFKIWIQLNLLITLWTLITWTPMSLPLAITIMLRLLLTFIVASANKILIPILQTQTLTILLQISMAKMVISHKLLWWSIK